MPWSLLVVECLLWPWPLASRHEGGTRRRSVPWRTLLVEPCEPARSVGLLDLAEHDRPRHPTPTLVVWVRTQGSRDRLRDRVSVLRRGLDDRRHLPHAAIGLGWLLVHAARVSLGRAAVLQITGPDHGVGRVAWVTWPADRARREGWWSEPLAGWAVIVAQQGP
jgi:hypothetical protein